MPATAGPLAETLDEHVAGCDECQAFLAELWIGELQHDLTEPVLRRIRFEQFLIDAAKFGFEVTARLAKGASHYLMEGDGPASNGETESDPNADPNGTTGPAG